MKCENRRLENDFIVVIRHARVLFYDTSVYKKNSEYLNSLLRAFSNQANPNLILLKQ